MEITSFNNQEKIDNTIFKMFDPSNNDTFLDMSEKELKKFLLLLEKYHIFYRDKLNINSKNTFGTEIECVNANIIKIIKLLKDSDVCREWTYKNDPSLPAEKKIIKIDGVQYIIKSKEFITDVLDNKKWDDLYKGCYIISNNSSINSCCGGHVHVGSQILGRKKQNWLDFFSLWSAYEDIAYRFGCGNDNYLRNGGLSYATPISYLWQNKLKKVSNKIPFERIINVFGNNKNNAVNLDHVDTFDASDVRYGNTVEFRLFNGCYNPIIIQNNINFVVHLMEYAASSDFDVMQVYYRREELYDDISLDVPKEVVSYYKDMDLFKSIELADMIFSNNLDKINFLKQCVKSVDTFRYNEENTKKLIK